MKEMITIRVLKKHIEEEYPIANAFALADALVSSGKTELSAEIREKLNFLCNNCKNNSWDEHWFLDLVVNHSIEDIKNRREIYQKYVGKDICRVDNLAVSSEKEAAYVSMFMELGFNDNQIECVMKRIVEHGTIAKSKEDAREIVTELEIFELSEEMRNQFIGDNADYLFNDYSREAKQVFDILCQRYGKEKGFTCLQEHPEYIRLGVKYIQ